MVTPVGVTETVQNRRRQVLLNPVWLQLWRAGETQFDPSRLTSARPEGAQMSYNYDGRKRLAQVFTGQNPAVLAATYGYDPAGNLQYNKVTVEDWVELLSKGL